MNLSERSRANHSRPTDPHGIADGRAKVEQPELFARAPYYVKRRDRLAARISYTHSQPYERWACGSAHYRQRYETLTRQRFTCWNCGYSLDPRWFDTHHLTYWNLGNEDPGDIVAVHRHCHRRLHERQEFRPRERDRWAA